MTTSPVCWEVARPWRRFARELRLAGAWFGTVSLLLVWAGGEAWAVALLAVAAGYVVGPLFVPTSIRMEPDGVHRASRFGSRFFPWTEFRAFTVGRRERAVFLARGGGFAGRLRGSVTLFLPEDAEQRQRAVAYLGGRLPGPGQSREGAG